MPQGKKYCYTSFILLQKYLSQLWGLKWEMKERSSTCQQVLILVTSSGICPSIAIWWCSKSPVLTTPLEDLVFNSNLTIPNPENKIAHSTCFIQRYKQGLFPTHPKNARQGVLNWPETVFMFKQLLKILRVMRRMIEGILTTQSKFSHNLQS